MKNYEILSLQDENLILVLSTSYVSPLSKVFLIAKELSSQNFKGEVIFDLLLSNGFTNNRFLKMQFDGEQLITNSTEILTNVDENVRKEIYDYYFGHPEYIDRSRLPMSQKYLLKNKLVS